LGGAAILAIRALSIRRDAGLRRSLRNLSSDAVAPPDRSWSLLMERVGRARLGRAVASRPGSGRMMTHRLSAAGEPWTAEGAAGRAVVAAGAGTIVGLGLAAIAPPAVVLAPIGALIGVRWPSLVLARRGRARRRRIETQVPELVELLVAASESGLPPPTAFVRSAEALDAPLGEELRVAVAQIRLGEPWRAALDAVVARTNAPSLAALARSLERSHRLGASVRGALRALVDDLRAERRARAEERARRAPVKMLFPLVFLILPAFLLLTVGPVLLSTVRSLH
jgi:tight adherence protein C